MALLLPNLKQALRRAAGVSDPATRAAVTGLETWANEMVQRLSELQAGSTVTLPIAESDVTNLVADLAAKVPTTRTITAGTGLSGGGDLSSNRTLSLANTAVTPGSYTLTNLTVDAQGRITAASSGTAAAVSDPGWYANISDGNVTFDGTTTVLGIVPVSGEYTLTRDIFCDSLTLNASKKIRTDGFRVHAKTLTCNGTLHNNGFDATASLQGKGANAGVVGGGTNGANTGAGTNNGSGMNGLQTADSSVVVQAGNVGLTPTVPCRGGGGGGDRQVSTNHTGGASGTITLTAPTYGGADITSIYRGSWAPNGPNMGGVGQWKGGTGGGAGSQNATAPATATAGKGGGGGGILVVVAKTLTGTGTISANGSAGWPASVTGSDAAAGGGGGGGGGVVLCIYGTRTGSLTIQANGSAGTAGAAVGAGNSGFAGGAGSNGVVLLCNTSGDGT